MKMNKQGSGVYTDFEISILIVIGMIAGAFILLLFEGRIF